ncbi:MAG: AURKAIP1/COX24 domain-containing protein [Anaerolineae bacterium]
MARVVKKRKRKITKHKLKKRLKRDRHKKKKR